MNKLKVVKSDLFYKSVKKLQKRYRNIILDVDNFLKNVKNNDDLGTSLGGGVYKVRVANSDANRGKSGGYRLLTYLQIIDNKVTLIYIYSKSDLENLSEQELDEMILDIFDD